jgi:hypothetical protein
MTPTGQTSFACIKDIECPISRYSNLQWFNFSEEGQLCTFDSEGVMRALSFRNYQWMPILDFKIKIPQSY